MKNAEKTNKSDSSIPWWVKSIVLIGVIGVICFKVIQTPLELKIDFPTLLSLLLAFFSVSLAALFYFKSTDNSNAFYDNTYKFTRDISDLLVKIESGFGEKLRHLDEAYQGMQSRFDQLPSKLQVKDVKKELKEEEDELQNIINEKEQLIEQLVNKAQLRDEEKSAFLNELNAKESALSEAKHEINFLRTRLKRAQLAEHENHDIRDVPLDIYTYVKEEVIQKIDPEYIASQPTTLIKKRFNRIKEELHPRFLKDMESHNYLDSEGELTRNGVKLIKRVALER